MNDTEDGEAAAILRTLACLTPAMLLARLYSVDPERLPPSMAGAALLRIAADLALLGTHAADAAIIEQQRLLVALSLPRLPAPARRDLCRLYSIDPVAPATPRRAIQRFYDEHGPLYNDRRPSASDDMHALSLLERILEPGRSVLDAGCGSGAPVGIRLAARYEWFGADLSLPQLQRVPDGLNARPRVAADVLQLPYREGAFDAVIAYYVLEHLPRPLQPAALQELRRVTKADGWLFLCLDVQDRQGDHVSYYGRKMWFSSYDAEQNRAIVEASGIEIVWQHLIGRGTATRLIVLGRRSEEPTERPAKTGAGERIALDRRYFPALPMARAAARALYRDKEPLLESGNGQLWRFRMADGLAAREARDPRLAASLRADFGVDLSRAARARWRRSGFGTEAHVSLQHTWALEAWSRRWSAIDRPETGPVTLLHLDSHSDLQNPLLRPTADRRVFESLTGHRSMDLRDPASVSRMIGRGAIGIGGFILPLLAALGAVRFIHVRPRLGAAAGCRVSRVDVVAGAAGGGLRLGAEGSEGGIELIACDNLDGVESLLGDGPLLLDIDLDYFDDRFDDSPGEKITATDAQVLEAVENTRVALEKALRGRIPDVFTLATSPEFFPSHLAAPALDRLCRA